MALLALGEVVAGGPSGSRKDRHGDPLPDGAIARLGTVRFRGAMPPLAFSPDGKLVASNPARGAGVILWEWATGRPLRRVGEEEGGGAQCIAFAPDGKRVAVSGSARCCVYDVAGGRQLFSVPGSHGTFSADGKLLVSADRYGAKPYLHVRDGKTGRPRGSWAIGRAAEYLSLAADGRTVALVDDRDPPVARVCAVATGKEIRAINLGQTGRALALSADGKLLAAAGGKEVRLWDVVTGKELRRWARRADSSPVFSADGKRLAWTGYDGIARTWVVERDGDRPRALGEPTNNFAAPCFSPDGKVLAVFTDANAVQLRDVATGKAVGPTEAHDSPVLDLALTADGRRVVSRSRMGTFAWEALTGRLLGRTAELPGGEYIEALLPDGRLLSADRTNDPRQGLFRLRDVRTGREVLRFEGRPDVGPPTAVVAPGGRYVALRGRAGEICVLDLRTNRCTYRLDPKWAASGLKISADGDVLVWYRRTPGGIEVHVRRHGTGKKVVLGSLPADDALDRWLAYMPCVSPDGRWLLAPGRGGGLRRWDLTTGKETSPLPEAQRTVWGLFWSPDGRFVAARGSESKSNVIDSEARQDVRVWDATTGKRLTHLNVPGLPECLLFSPDGRTVLTPDPTGTVRLWEVATGKERRRLPGHPGTAVAALALGADGLLLVSGGYDSQVLVWDLTGRAPDGHWQTARLPAAQLRSSWEALAGADAGAAFRAMWTLSADPDGSLALLRKQLTPAPSADPARVRQLIADLDHDRFSERERARVELEKLGESAVGELRKALAKSPPLEARRRLDALLLRCERPPAGETLRALRSVEVLERIGTPEARRLLSTLAGEAPGARLTQEAAASLRRLGGR